MRWLDQPLKVIIGAAVLIKDILSRTALWGIALLSSKLSGELKVQLVVPL